MQKIDKDKLKNIVSSLMLKPNDEVIDGILDEWVVIEKSLKLLDDLDLENVKPLSHLNETPLIDFLREDEVKTDFAISKAEALANAKKHDQDYILTSKVVHNED